MSTAVQEVEVERTETGELVATVVPAVELRNALSACLLAVDKGTQYLPVLHAVHVAKAGNELTFRGTDRYRLVVVTVTLRTEQDGDWSTLIDAVDVKRIVGMLPKTEHKYNGGVTLATIALNEVTLLGAGSASFTPIDGEFPRTASLIPTSTEAVEEIGFKPEQLADLAKMPGRRKNQPLFFKFNGAGKSVLVTWTDENHENVEYSHLLMPVRRNS